MRNQRIFKAGLLTLMIGLPVFIYSFLVVFGENKYELPVYNPKSVDCVSNQTNEKDTLHRIPPFELLDQDSNLFSDADLENKIYVANFILTRCPNGICPAMSNELVRVQEDFKDRDDVQLISYSIDPEFDSPSVLKEFGEYYGANPNIWKFLTGSSQEIYQQSKCGYFVAVRMNEDGSFDFDHDKRLILVDKDQRIRGFYDGTNREEVDRLIVEIKILLQEYEQNS